ncbi:MAG: hypothetical protein WD887_02490 [Candidatus Saccharimonadales bacterium]
MGILGSIKPNLVNEAAASFLSAEAVYSVPVDFPTPYPCLYVANGLGEAALDVMIANNLMGPDVIENIRLRQRLEEAIKEVVPNSAQIVLKREIGARILNNYSPDGEFNPN